MIFGSGLKSKKQINDRTKVIGLNYSKVDTDFDIVRFAEKQLMSKFDITEEGNFITKDTYQPNFDGIVIYPKTLTNGERDEVSGDCFISINGKHQPFMRYGATKLLMYIYGDTKEQARNRATKLIKNDYEDKLEEKANNFIVAPNGSPYKIWENLKVLYDIKGIKLKYNELKQTIESNIEWFRYDDFITDMNSQCILNGFKLSKDNLYDFNAYIAHLEAYNPVKQYLDKCYEEYKKTKHDHSYIEELFNTINFSKEYTKQDIEFNKQMLIKWLMTGAKLASNDGSLNAEFILIFKGEQGKGKTRWFRSLMPKEYNTEFFKDGEQLNPTSKDDVSKLISYWLVELGEIGATMKKSDRDSLKAWITSPSDEYRSPYARKAEKYPRRTFICGTVNDDEFLRDETGNRRFVVMNVDRLNHTHNVNIDMMWGEVMSLLEHTDIPTYLTPEEIEILNKRNREYIVRSNEQIVLEEYLPNTEERGYITAAALSKYLNEVHGYKLEPRRIGKALKGMGYELKECRLNGVKGRYYEVPFINGYSMPF